MDSIALPFIRRGLMKYFPLGDTLSKNQLQKARKPIEQLSGGDMSAKQMTIKPRLILGILHVSLL